MKTRLLVISSTLLLLIGYGLVAQKTTNDNVEPNIKKVEITILSENNDGIIKFSEVIEVASRSDLSKYLAAKGFQLADMDIYKSPPKFCFNSTSGDAWIIHRNEDYKNQKGHAIVFVDEDIDEEDVDDNANKVEKKIVVKVNYNGREGNDKKTKSYRMEKTIDKNGNVIVKKYINGEEVDPSTPIPGRKRFKHKIRQGGEDLEVNIEEVVNGKDCDGKMTLRGHRQVSGIQKMIARSKDGKTTVFVTPINNMDNDGVQLENENDKHLKLENIKFYPNPNNGEFQISFKSAEKGNLKIEILDMSGRLINSENLENITGEYSKSYDLRDENTGVYIVKISQSGKSYSHRLLIH